MYVSMLTSSYTHYNSFIFNISAFDIFILVETFLHSRNAEKFLTACVFRIENLCHLTTLLTNFLQPGAAIYTAEVNWPLATVIKWCRSIKSAPVPTDREAIVSREWSHVVRQHRERDTFSLAATFVRVRRTQVCIILVLKPYLEYRVCWVVSKKSCFLCFLCSLVVSPVIKEIKHLKSSQ